MWEYTRRVARVGANPGPRKTGNGASSRKAARERERGGDMWERRESAQGADRRPAV